MRQPPTLTESLMAEIRARIASGALGPGDRLPSIRRFAVSTRSSPSTVAEAYARLEAEGVIRAQRGSGFYVASAALAPPSFAATGPSRDRAIDPFWVSKQSLDADPSFLMPGCGWLPASWMPQAALRKALRALSHTEDALLVEYGGTRGHAALRRLLQARCADDGISVRPEQILLTGSGTHAIDLICRLLLRPGDTVLVDDPCYFNFQALLRAHRARVVGVPFTQAGPDVAAFEAVCAAERPRLYITNSALHNPTGATLSPQTAHRVLAAAAAHDMMIVEDEIFADFEPAPSPRLAVLDGLERVLRIGSFSKTLSASLRCGYIAARADWIERLVDLQVATSFGGPSPVATEALASVLAGGGYRRHMAQLQQRLTAARHDAGERLLRLGILPWLMPRGGFLLWSRLPAGIDSAGLARRCLDEQVIMAPGNVFSVSQTATAFVRMNVAQMSDPRVDAVLERALASCARTEAG
ncbi:MAG: PLP-dependent aminotransferase family protein [Thermomicrobiales bacterium]